MWYCQSIHFACNFMKHIFPKQILLICFQFWYGCNHENQLLQHLLCYYILTVTNVDGMHLLVWCISGSKSALWLYINYSNGHQFNTYCNFIFHFILNLDVIFQFYESEKTWGVFFFENWYENLLNVYRKTTLDGDINKYCHWNSDVLTRGTGNGSLTSCGECFIVIWGPQIWHRLTFRLIWGS